MKRRYIKCMDHLFDLQLKKLKKKLFLLSSVLVLNINLATGHFWEPHSRSFPDLSRVVEVFGIGSRFDSRVKSSQVKSQVALNELVSVAQVFTNFTGLHIK